MSKSKKTTSTTEIPKWLESGSQFATGRAREIADRPYVEYTDQRIAGLDPSEQQAYDLAQQGVGMWGGDLDRAREMTERGSQSFLDADVQGYMNPYVEGALEPAARELREEGQRQQQRVGQQAGMTGAFGGSRQAILEAETGRGSTEALSDLYGRGYERAFESATERFDSDRAAAARGAEQFRALGAQGQQQFTQDMQNLLTTGGLKRQLDQAGLDFDYSQFLEARDWDITNLQPLLATLASVPYSTKSTNKTKTSGLGNAIGVAAAAYGTVMSGGLSGLGGGGGDDTGGGGSAPAPGGGGGVPSFGSSGVDGGGTGGQSVNYQPAFFGSAYTPVSLNA